MTTQAETTTTLTYTVDPSGILCMEGAANFDVEGYVDALRDALVDGLDSLWPGIAVRVLTGHSRSPAITVDSDDGVTGGPGFPESDQIVEAAESIAGRLLVAHMEA